MAEAKPWDAVFERVRISRPPGDVWPTVPETELDAAEAALGAPLPASYRAFATRFGLGGEFWGVWRLRALFTDKEKQQRHTVSGRTREMRYFVSLFSANPSPAHEQGRRFVFFIDDGGRGDFTWDPGAPTSTDPVEYPVYWYPRASPEVYRWADTFAEFVNRLDAEFRKRADQAGRMDTHIGWSPAGARKRKKPPKRDTKLWLTFNNGTARDIALSIRDEGRADAFLILADALQDADCAHADLLDACRTGDPDIDGKWVLQVLLGRG